MKRLSSLFRLLPTALLVLVLAASAVRAEERPAVHDAAGLFGPSALAQARQSLDALYHRHGVVVRVETVSTYPKEAGRRGLFGPKPPSDAYFSTWANSVARSHPDADVVIFVCQNPVRVRVVQQVGGKEPVLTERERDGLRRQLEISFARKQYEAGLGSGLAFLGDRAEVRLDPQSHLPFNWLGMGLVVGGLVAFWLVMGPLRYTLRGGREQTNPNEGITSGLLGGGIGAAAYPALADLLRFGPSFRQPPQKGPSPHDTTWDDGPPSAVAHEEEEGSWENAVHVHG